MKSVADYLLWYARDREQAEREREAALEVARAARAAMSSGMPSSGDQGVMRQTTRARNRS